MNVEAVFFDVGGTLLHPHPSVAETISHVARQRGHNVSTEDVEPYMPLMQAYYEREYARNGDFWCSHEGSSAIWLSQYSYVCRLVGISDDASGMAQEIHNAYRKGDHWGLYTDVEVCLGKLKERGIGLGVVSNWDNDLEDILDDVGLLPYFDVVIASASVGCRKPDPAIFNLACKRMGICASATLHVGDRPDADGVGAQAAGVYPVIVDRQEREVGCGFARVANLVDIGAFLHR